MLRVLALAGAVLALAISAWVTIPIGDVPATLQTLAVPIVGAALGWRSAVFAALAYLVAGALGAPVFAGGAAGPEHLVGPTAGYLVSFVPAAALAGWLCHRTDNLSLTGALGVTGVATLTVLVLGWSYLATSIGPGAAFARGVQPFLLGGLAKALVGAPLVLWVRRWHAPERPLPGRLVLPD